MRGTVTASALLVLITCSRPADQSKDSTAHDRTRTTTEKLATPATNFNGPSRTEAAEVIEKSELFHQRAEFLAGFPVTPFRLSDSGGLRHIEEHLATHGWITVNGEAITATPKALTSRYWRPSTAPGHFNVLFDDRQVVGVTGILVTGHNAYTVEFNWRWVPNEVGSGLSGAVWSDHFGAVMRATAVIRRYDDGWRVTETSKLEGLLSERVNP